MADDEEEGSGRKKTPRDRELSGRAAVRDELVEIFQKDVEPGYIDAYGRVDDQLDYWDLYNCQLSTNQFYNGNSKVCLPIVETAIDARKTRFVNQLFPQTGRYVEVIDENADPEDKWAIAALAEHYIRRSKLKTQIARPLIVNGDVEGQYSLYVSWGKCSRHEVKRSFQQVRDADGESLVTDEEVEGLDEEEVTDEGPLIEVISDADLLILPLTSEGVEDALERGGSVTVMRRWTKGQIKQMMADGEFTRQAGETILEAMKAAADRSKTDIAKEKADAAGIKGGGKYVLGYETWTKRVKVDGLRRLTRTYYGGNDVILGCKLCPYWCDLCPVISVPREKVNGLAKGRSAITGGIQTLAYAANDVVNEAFDSATYSMLPIVMTDPAKNPKVGTMVMDLAAVWETSPQDTKFAQFPDLWKSGFELVAAVKAEIYQALSVNPSMVPQSSGRPGSKRNQAEIANEQMVDVLTTADAVGVLEEGVFSPLVERIIWYDHQFRDKAITVKAYGALGRKAEMQSIDPISMGNAYSFSWYGVEQARSAQAIQQQIAALNVMRGIPEQLYRGHKLNVVPILERLAEVAFGARVATKVFQSMADDLSVDPDEENEMLAEGFDIEVSPFDDDKQHLQVHAQAMGGGDPTGQVRVHMMKHMAQMQAKMAAQQQQQQGQQGVPGGAGPGVAGTPKPGSQPANPRQGRGPPGMIPQDNMNGSGGSGVVMPRRN